MDTKSDPCSHALGPLDGRYRHQMWSFSLVGSEAALIGQRVKMEIDYFLALADTGIFGLSKEEAALIQTFADLTTEDHQLIKNIEVNGAVGFSATNHDVKAVEYYLQHCFRKHGLERLIPWIHFGLTSEDVNNISYAHMLRSTIELHVMLKLRSLLSSLKTDWIEKYAGLAMLARTHGQPASPTTLGKEIAVFYHRLQRELQKLETFQISVKLNGATGNYNALHVALPEVNWPGFSRQFIDGQNHDHSVKFVFNSHTTQIEPHDSYAELFQLMMRVNNILLDFVQDMWRYVSDNWIVQKPVSGQIGSSAMPHKVNPIHLENAEGNLGLANALFEFFARKLTVSRLQRDLSDSTVARNFGVAFGHSLLAYMSITKGLEKMSANEEVILAELNRHPEVIAEAIQTILRANGVSDAYEQLKAFSRGKPLSMSDFTGFIESLDVPEEVKVKLRQITPENYTGLAETIALSEL